MKQKDHCISINAAFVKNNSNLKNLNSMNQYAFKSNKMIKITIKILIIKINLSIMTRAKNYVNNVEQQ